MAPKTPNHTSRALGTRAKPMQATARDAVTLVGVFQPESCVTANSPLTVPWVTAPTITSALLTHQAHTVRQRCHLLLPTTRGDKQSQQRSSGTVLCAQLTAHSAHTSV